MSGLFTKIAGVSVDTIAHCGTIGRARIRPTRAVMHAQIAVAAGKTLLARFTKPKRWTLTVEAKQSIVTNRSVGTRIR